MNGQPPIGGADQPFPVPRFTASGRLIDHSRLVENDGDRGLDEDKRKAEAASKEQDQLD